MDDTYIRAIRYAINQNGKFPLSQLLDHLSLDEPQKEALLHEIYEKKILSHNIGNDWPRFLDKPETISVRASAEDRFRLIDYDELQEARAAAVDANKHAIIAIAISAILALFSIALSIKQMYDSDQEAAAVLKRLENITSTMEMIEARALLREPVINQQQASQPISPSHAPP